MFLERALGPHGHTGIEQDMRPTRGPPPNHPAQHQLAQVVSTAAGLSSWARGRLSGPSAGAALAACLGHGSPSSPPWPPPPKECTRGATNRRQGRWRLLLPLLPEEGAGDHSIGHRIGHRRRPSARKELLQKRPPMGSLGMARQTDARMMPDGCPRISQGPWLPDGCQSEPWHGITSGMAYLSKSALRSSILFKRS